MLTHILNLVTKSVLHQFEAPKAKEGDVIDDAAKQLAAILNELDNENNSKDAGSDSDGDNDDASSDSDGSDEHDNDNNDRLVDEHDGMSEEELESLEESETNLGHADKGLII